MQDNNSTRNTTNINTDEARPLAKKELSIEDLRGVRGAAEMDDAGDCGCEKCKCKGESADSAL